MGSVYRTMMHASRSATRPREATRAAQYGTFAVLKGEIRCAKCHIDKMKSDR